MQGRSGVEVRSYPGPGGMWKVTVSDATSVGGGVFPRWSPTGHELFILTGSLIFAAPYTVAGNEFRAGTPVRWSPATYSLLGVRDVPYAIHPDGHRIAILANHTPVAAQVREVVFIFNFRDSLASLVQHKGE